jgi:MFS family permease
VRAIVAEMRRKGDRYRWLVLAVGTAAQASVWAVLLGVAVLAPELRAHYHLTLAEVGVVLAALSIGATPMLLLWGVLADRVGGESCCPSAWRRRGCSRRSGSCAATQRSCCCSSPSARSAPT